MLAPPEGAAVDLVRLPPDHLTALSAVAAFRVVFPVAVLIQPVVAIFVLLSAVFVGVIAVVYREPSECDITESLPTVLLSTVFT